MNSSNLNQKARNIKISRRYVRSRGRSLPWKESRVPKIVISGEYLREAGFKIGETVNISFEKLEGGHALIKIATV